jgi:hypothetical protein
MYPALLYWFFGLPYFLLCCWVVCSLFSGLLMLFDVHQIQHKFSFCIFFSHGWHINTCWFSFALQCRFDVASAFRLLFIHTSNPPSSSTRMCWSVSLHRFFHVFHQHVCCLTAPKLLVFLRCVCIFSWFFLDSLIALRVNFPASISLEQIFPVCPQVFCLDVCVYWFAHFWANIHLHFCISVLTDLMENDRSRFIFQSCDTVFLEFLLYLFVIPPSLQTSNFYWTCLNLFPLTKMFSRVFGAVFSVTLKTLLRVTQMLFPSCNSCRSYRAIVAIV